ncbi:MAG: hypothetical protein ABIJ11_07250 [Elusimicrobiota bacterium]
MKKKLTAYLVHHTGSMIRFVTSQLPYLPKSDKFVYVVLPSGESIKCKFHLHRANPYMAGSRIIHWIKGIIPFGNKRKIMIHIISQNKYFVYMKGQVGRYKKAKKIQGREKNCLKKLIKKLLGISTRPTKSRHKMYNKLLSERVNSDLVKKVFGVKCQIQDCEYSVKMNKDLMSLTSEVHHLEHLSRGGSNSPYNLAVVCANHHAILHRDKTAKIIKNKGDNVLVTYLNRKINKWICRDLSVLHNQ